MLLRIFRFFLVLVKLTAQHQFRTGHGNRTPIEENVAVMLTSHGKRVNFAWLTVARILDGTVRPGAIILVLSKETKGQRLPRSLEKLTQLGLQIAYEEDLGPYTKWWHAPKLLAERDISLVAVCDDDTLQNRDWLELLLSKFSAEIGSESSLVVTNGALSQPEGKDGLVYKNCKLTFAPGQVARPICMGHQGFLVATETLGKIRDLGTQFLKLAPRQDDLYFSYVLRHLGIRVVNCDKAEPVLENYLAWKIRALHLTNNLASGNDATLDRLTKHPWSFDT